MRNTNASIMMKYRLPRNRFKMENSIFISLKNLGGLNSSALMQSSFSSVSNCAKLLIDVFYCRKFMRRRSVGCSRFESCFDAPIIPPRLVTGSSLSSRGRASGSCESLSSSRPSSSLWKETRLTKLAALMRRTNARCCLCVISKPPLETLLCMPRLVRKIEFVNWLIAASSRVLRVKPFASCRSPSAY